MSSGIPDGDEGKPGIHHLLVRSSRHAPRCDALLLPAYPSPMCVKKYVRDTTEKEYHDVPIHPLVPRPRDLCLRLWLHDVSSRGREASKGKEAEPISRSSLRNIR